MASLHGRRKIREDIIFDIVTNTLLLLAVFVVLYPLYFVVLASISDPTAVNRGKMLFWPVDITFAGYKYVLRDSRIWLGYMNTIIYTTFGTLFALFLTISGGYALSRHDLPGNSFFMKMLVFTMYFSGGLIPLYMVVRGLNLIDKRMVLIILGSFSAYNTVIARTFFRSKIPYEFFEAASLDGCGNGRFFFSVVIPLSKEIIAVIALFYAVGHWNSYFNALIYINDRKLYPLQLILRELLIISQSVSSSASVDEITEMQKVAETIKYGVILVSSLPILLLYPFLQRFFVNGIMIGGIKG